MTIEIKVPDLPESVADATIATWYKQPGEPVERDEILVDIETDKVVLEVPAPETGVLEEAIYYYQRALSHRGNVVAILNSLGECYFKLGNNEQALRAWKKSLEINPKQEKIKKIIEQIKESPSVNLKYNTPQ